MFERGPNWFRIGDFIFHRFTIMPHRWKRIWRETCEDDRCSLWHLGFISIEVCRSDCSNMPANRA